jgi:CheY-like chemotaxis protein
MGGEIAVVSKPDEGTTFKFNMQSKKAEGYYNDQLMLPDSGLNGTHILIVDDNTTLRLVLAAELRHWGALPVEAVSSRQALEILAVRNDIKTILIDLHMPETNGIQLAENIRKNYSNIHIFLLNKLGNILSETETSLFNAVVHKPIKYPALHHSLLIRYNKRTNAERHPSAKSPFTADFARKFPLDILIAEDNLINQKLIMRVLNKLDYEPDAVPNGLLVLESLKARQYQLIFMDVQMPEMDGLETTRQIRLDKSMHQPVIIAMTANALPEDREICLRAGMDDYLSKPIKVEDILVVLEKWWSKTVE